MGRTMKMTPLLTVAALATPALGASQLQIDLNSLTTTIAANGAAMENTRGSSFDTNFTGMLMLTDDIDSTLAGMLINGNEQTITGTLQNFTGSIMLENGSVAGGSFEVTVLESDAMTTNTYTASIVDGAGQVNTQAGQGFSIDGLTFEGMFTSDVFAGVDIEPWFAAQPLRGSFLEFQFDPGDGMSDTDSDMDVFVVVPMPVSGGLAAAGLVGLVGLRRRR